VDNPLKLFFENLKNHHGNNIYQKHCFISEINIYSFKVTTTIFLWKFNMFQESFYMFKAFKKNMWTSVFYIKSLFPLSNVHQIVWIFSWILIYSTRRDPCVQNIQKIEIHILKKINTQMLFNTIIVLNL
jgi:hypothetical protein